MILSKQNGSTQTYDINTWEAEAGRSTRVQGYPGLYSDLNPSMGHILTSCSKNMKERK